MNKAGPIIDSHVHYYPQEVREDPARWADSKNEAHWKELVVGTDKKHSIQGWASDEKLISDMDEAGIDKVILQGWYWEHQTTCHWQNESYATLLNKHPDRLIAFASVQPREGKKALDDLKVAVDKGAKGIGEVFPKVQGFKVDSPDWLVIVEWAISQELPITMHVTEPVGHSYAGRVDAPLSDYQWLAEKYPELKLILAHWGGLLPFYELNPYLKKVFKNVYYDTAANPLLYDNKIYRLAIEAIGPDKILFGSDYPLRVYPKKQKEPNLKDSVAEVKGLGLKDTEYASIMGGNVSRILGLE